MLAPMKRASSWGRGALAPPAASWCCDAIVGASEPSGTQVAMRSATQHDRASSAATSRRRGTSAF